VQELKVREQCRPKSAIGSAHRESAAWVLPSYRKIFVPMLGDGRPRPGAYLSPSRRRFSTDNRERGRPMGLYLRSIDVDRFDATLSTLLSPFQYEDANAWCTQLAANFMELLGGDHAVIALMRRNFFAGCVTNMRDDVVVAHLKLLSSCGPTSAQTMLGIPSDGLHDGVMARIEGDREREGAEIWSRVGSYIQATKGARNRGELSFMGEVLDRGRVRDSHNIDTVVDGAYVVVCVSYEHGIESRTRSDVARRAGQSLLRLLLPAVRTSARMWAARAQTPDGQKVADIDQLSVPAATFDSSGRGDYANVELRNVLNGDKQGSALLDSMRGAAANQLHGSRRQLSEADGNLFRVVRNDAATYQVAPSRGEDDRCTVTARRISSGVRNHEAARQHGRLSNREWEVAQMLAIRATNREIASALQLSAHTVRHHIEHVFAKLNVKSRRDVAVRLRELT